jgi:hypothetical protein
MRGLHNWNSKFIQNRPFVRRTSFTDKTGRPVSIRSIRKVEYFGEKPVYDISTASETFVAGGMLCHNSGTSACCTDNIKINVNTGMLMYKPSIYMQ